MPTFHVSEMAAGTESMTGENVDELGTQEVPVNQKLTFEVLQIVKEAQQQHGLRHGDFQRYRGYCSRRIRRLRKSLHFPQGNNRKVLPKKIDMETVTDVRFLHLPLFCAERAWYYAMQLKSEANTEQRKKFHTLAKIKKAVTYAEELAELCKSPKCDAQTQLESQAYLSWIQAGMYFEQEVWDKAMKLYTQAKTIYEKLASAFTEDSQALYLQMVDEVSPNIRYCAYNIGDESAIAELKEMRRKGGEDQLTSHLDDLLSQTREKQTATLSEVTWLGRSVPVKSEPVRVFLLNVQESTKEIESTEGIDGKISIYESLLKQCIDAQQIMRDSLSDDANFKASQRGQAIEGKISNQHYLHSYLMYIRLSKTVDRNLLLIEKLKQYLPGKSIPEGHKITKPQDLVRLYDIIIQNLNEIPNLQGVETDLSEETAVKSTSYKAFRSYYIAQSFLAAKKWTETIALYERVLKHASQALKGCKKLKNLSKQEISSIEELVNRVNGEKYSCHANSILDLETVAEPVADISLIKKKPLIDRFDDYIEDKSVTTKKPNLVSFPPDFEPIPCRPLFFDLALNHVDFPSIESKMEQKKSGGLTGMVKGWLWGGGKK
ncbi:signal recognition particle subunit SRP68 [Mytilus galloprovincialis]|uniref:Signal recognition particle subunit SRP68 n=2 Tax=Mytilus galloprovincialis TaxID=29158 RepID=A0A8B6H4W1_MYTGA|nr:signal recognition particle subunit SRP68 [Mytilus galloprovincialis]